MVASAQPFLPGIASLSGGTIRGDIPMPEGRPYTLGHTTADVASINATSAISASRRPQAVTASYESRELPALRPVSAYAPLRNSFASDPVSGRGLY
jgi:rare lipoprotein A